MEIGKSNRNRAVRLTDEALSVLQSRLLDEWRKAGVDERLTWPARAGLLEVSVSTAKRILGQKGNDPAALIRAFASLGLEWRDEYCEPMPGSERADEVDVAEAVSIIEPSGVEIAVPARWQWPRLVLWAGTTSVGLALIAILVLGQAKPSSAERSVPYDQRPQSQAVELARLAYLRADYEVAKGHVENAKEVAYHEQDPNAMAEAIRVEGEIWAAQGSLERAYDCFKISLGIRVPFKQTWGRASLLNAMALVEQKLGKLDEAEAHLRDSLASMRFYGDSGGTAEALRELGSIAAKRGDRSIARKRFAAARAAISDRPKEAMHIDIRARMALLLADEGQYDAALQDLTQCLEEWRELNHPRWTATTLLQIGKVEWSAGRVAESRRAIEEAKVNFESVGDRLGVQECAAWLAKHGGRSELVAALMAMLIDQGAFQ